MIKEPEAGRTDFLGIARKTLPPAPGTNVVQSQATTGIVDIAERDDTPSLDVDL